MGTTAIAPYSGSPSGALATTVVILSLLLNVIFFWAVGSAGEKSALAEKHQAGKPLSSNKIVIGVGVKKSTSDLLIANCDEFIFYDDLVREEKKTRIETRKEVIHA